MTSDEHQQPETPLAPVETKNLDIYGGDPLPWSRATEALAAARGPGTTFFLGTVSPDGRPHAAGVGALWHGETLWFVSGPGTRKSRNIAADPRCTVSCRLAGLDLVLEGRASRVIARDALKAVAAEYRAGGWPATVQEDTFVAPYSAPSAGPPPWHLYRLEVATAFGVATVEPSGATRWRF